MKKLERKLFLPLLLVLAMACFALASLTATIGVKAESKNLATDAPKGTQETVAEKIEELASFEVVGGEIRIVEPFGLRFVTRISDADLAKLPEDAVFGTLIIPTDVLGENDLTLSTERVANAVANVGYLNVAEGYKAFTGTLVGSTLQESFLASDYGRGFVAVGYVTYTYGTETDTIYTPQVTKYFAKIANDALVDHGADYSDVEDELKGIVNATVKDLAVNVNETSFVTGDSVENAVTGILDNCPIATIETTGAVGYDEATNEFYAKSVGTGTFTVSVPSVEIEIVKEATVSAIELEDNFDIVEFRRNSDNAIDLSNIESNASVITKAFATNNVTSFKINTVEQTTKPTVSNKSFVIPATAPRGKVAVEAVLTDVSKGIDYTFKFNTKIIDYSISTKDDFDKINEISAQSGITDVNDGYFMLANDIQYNAVRPYDKAVGSWYDDGGDGTKGFKGTLDGDGHFINGLTIVAGGGNYWFAGIFKTLATGSVIKNIAFVNAYLDNGSAHCGYLAATASAGALIQDVMISGYVKQNSSSLAPSLTIGYSTKAYTCRRVVAALEKRGAETCWGSGSQINPIAISAAATYEDCYMIGFNIQGSHEGLKQKNVNSHGNVHCQLAIRSNDNTLLGDLIRSDIDAKFGTDGKIWGTWQSGTGSDTYSRVYLCFKGCLSYCDWSGLGGPKGANSGNYVLPA